MELPVPPKFHVRNAASDCNEAVKAWRLRAEAAQAHQKVPASGEKAEEAIEKLDKDIDKQVPTVTSLGEYGLLVGDAQGIRYAKAGKEVDASGFRPSVFTNPQRIFSASKWLTASALGAAVKSGVFSWNDPVNKYINWWTKDAKDPRSKITFASCLSHTSGLIMDTALAHALGLNKVLEHTDVGLGNNAYSLEESAQKAFNMTKPDSKLFNVYRYGETHYFVAQFAALQASGLPTWQDFMARFFGEPLDLQPEVEDPEHDQTKSYFRSKSPYAYGFHFDSRRSGDVQVNNPDGGGAMVVSPCAYARFLTSYLGNGDMMWGASQLDQDWADTGQFKAFGLGEVYALGHWKFKSGALKGTEHSLGFGGALPMITATSGGKPFWIYVSRFQIGGMMPSVDLVGKIMADVQSLMEAPPPVDSSTCPP